MTSYKGLDYVFDLEACMKLSSAGHNHKIHVFERAKESRIAITREVFKQVQNFDKELAEEIKASDFEIIDCDDTVYEAAQTYTDLLTTYNISISRATDDKIPIIALVHCAKNGKVPSCSLVTGDNSQHESSMANLCSLLKISISSIDQW